MDERSRKGGRYGRAERAAENKKNKLELEWAWKEQNASGIECDIFEALIKEGGNT